MFLELQISIFRIKEYRTFSFAMQNKLHAKIDYIKIENSSQCSVLNHSFIYLCIFKNKISLCEHLKKNFKNIKLSCQPQIWPITNSLGLTAW